MSIVDAFLAMQWEAGATKVDGKTIETLGTSRALSFLYDMKTFISNFQLNFDTSWTSIF